mgnify:CR=1 FL=1|tara:strand:- start:483 stop:2129 length:1647 start_codon:yes stop_codon:yes gene_type:complete
MSNTNSSTKLELPDLLGRGYFPDELPPPFTTKSFAGKVTKKGVKLPIEFTKKKGKWCEYTPYSLARPGALRRRLGILNPLAFYRLSKEVVTSQKVLFKKAESCVVALSKPRVSTTKLRAILTSNTLSDLPIARAKSRVGKLFALHTDISRFYPSIYTHSLDWAITGKVKAKSTFGRGVNRLGTRIDAHVQAAQNGQTRGLPIGPDTSLLLAHVLLAPVDKILKKKGITHGFRFMDDYELVFKTRAEADAALAALEEALSEYELELNTHKTSIHELPLELDSPAIVELRNHPLESYNPSHSELLSFFNKAFLLAKETPNKPILQFAIGRINNLDEIPTDRELTQDLVLQCATIEPGTWRRAVRILQRLHASAPLSTKPIQRVIEVTIQQQAPRQHSSEVAWALWATLVFKIDLSIKEIKAVIKMRDDVCSLLLLHAEQEGLAQFDGWCIKHIVEPASASELYGEHWLFSYEAVKKKWITPKSGNYLTSDPVFGFMENQDINFYDDSILAEARDFKASDEAEDEAFSYATHGTNDGRLDLFDDYDDEPDF